QPKPSPPAVPRSTPVTTTNGSQGTTDDPFGDILSSISWRNGGRGKDALDQLAKKTDPAQKKQPPPGRLWDVAFAQAAGFDANGAAGYGEDSNLNSAIGKANNNCVANAKTMCGDEGYCMLRPGEFGAFATDRTYIGNKAFACNLKTEEDAI